MSTHDFLGLTPAMTHLLATADQAGKVSPWGYASHTVGAAKKRGFLQPVKTTWVYEGKKRSKTDYELTAAGRAALKGTP